MGDSRQNIGEGREACSSDISRSGRRRTAQNDAASFSVNFYGEEDACELAVYCRRKGLLGREPGQCVAAMAIFTVANRAMASWP